MRLAFICLCAWLAALALIRWHGGTSITQRAVAPLLRPDDGPAHEALDEVNAARAKKGLKPFVRDDGLTAGAKAAAAYRAEYRIKGHTKDDFAFLHAGVKADAAGCAAWPPQDGWGSCCTYDRGYTYAGAAWAMGKDGRRFMHLFVKR